MPRTTVVFYQDDEAVPILDWLRRLPAKVRVKCLAYLAQLETFGHELRRPTADYLRDGIHELRPSYQGIHYRILYFFPAQPENLVVVSHGLVKEGSVTDADIERAARRKRDFEADPGGHTFKPKF